MGLIERLGSTKLARRLFSGAIKRELERIPQWLSAQADAQRYDMPDPYIYMNQADMFRVSSNLSSALDILGRHVGMAGFNVSRVVGEEERDIKNHDFEKLIQKPNPLNSGFELKRDTIIQRLLNGNAVWWLNRTSWLDKPLEIWHIPYNKIKPVPDGRMYLSHYEFSPGGTKTPIDIPVWQIVHFKGFNPFNPFAGLSLVESLAITLYGDIGMRKTAERTYTKYGGAPQSILAFKDYVNNEAWEDIKIEKQNAALKNEMMMLRGVGDGVSWMSRATSNKDAEFIEMLRQNMTDIFNRVAPGLLAALDSQAKYSNADAGRKTYDDFTLYPYLMELSAKITNEILPVYGRNLKGEFDDPRDTDRAMEMKEIETFSLFHTIDEVRTEKYKNDPIGDERGKLLVAEVKVASNPFGSSEQQPPADEQAQGDDTQDEETDQAVKAALEDLARLRTMALKGKTEKIKAFRSDYIPAGMLRSIRAQLAIKTEKADIIGLFEEKAESLRPKPQIDPYVILSAMDKSLKALEKG